MLIGSKRSEMNINDEKLDDLIEGLAKNEKPQYLVIGVRPKAFMDFERIRSKAEFNKIDFGYEPIEEDIKIKFPTPKQP